jgi:cholesterol transport system auxiliary component
LIRQRFAERVAQDATAEEADSMPLLRIELDEFIQIFDTPTKSRVKVQLRAIIRSPKTPAYSRDRIFVVEKPASSGDSEGAIRAFAAAVDQIVADTLIWSAQR